ncbi:MAG: class I SAM-dependent methyltransferase [Pseudonocardiales bacterium]
MALDELKLTWERLGRTDPLWAVLSDPAKRGGGWDTDEFMATGTQHVALILDALEHAGVLLGNRVLDFGCGVGRLSNVLAEHARSVAGVDIADSMIEQARQLNRHPDRLEFYHYDGHWLPFDDNSFDSAVSLMVLQHSPPAVQLSCLLELQRVVRPGGVIAVQIPSELGGGKPFDPTTYRAGIELLTVPVRLGPGQQVTVRAAVTNTSPHCWPVDHPLRLGNHWLADAEMVVQDDGRTDLPHGIEPGESVQLDLAITAPGQEGRFELELDLVHELVTWWGDVGSRTTRVPVEVTAGGEAVFADATMGTRVAAAPVVSPVVEDEQAHGAVPYEMRGLHVDLVRSLFTHCGSRVLRSWPDELAGAEWTSYLHVIQIGG